MNKNKLTLFLLLLSLILIFTLNTTAENLKIHFIDVGQGDSILIEEVGGQNILVDGGDRADKITAGIINYLRDQNVKKLDYLISTHPHADHIGGLVDIIDSFEVGTVLDSGKVHTSKTYENYLIKIDQENINFETPRRGDKFKIGESELHFLHPEQNLEAYDLNNSSLVFLLEFRQQNFLFTGDIEAEVERKLLAENPELKVDIIKVPHHGSKTSSFAGWIKSIQPETAVIQVGENHYGHPAAKIIELYQSQGARVFRNDLNGNIVVTADGKNYTVKVDQSTDNSRTGTKTNTKNENTSAEKIKSKSKNKADSSNLININTASAAVLDQLWGIGPATAEKIIHYREKNGLFTQIEEIKKVDGIDDGKFGRWYDKITVE
ncbi:competence protein ComEC [Halanaerobium saccharolyticum]|uniref:Competence protein ComEC n=1 Tax=Halanaerobium saccharolyticum TaxID=43595 RepID=A0A4R7Z508_9FIRM|nr:MBL fold metallo-hydrolase [Halanaerobium saccharolyticum]RAK08153.1 competence protein ComEC [Halanaerobium saccharolyticum]TDW04360.1 competence protein ComEC [Halanaerobium saccharolyticum]TDX59651.1 competence protein ComEC [Halanaerobium saccharolyticum]